VYERPFIFYRLHDNKLKQPSRSRNRSKPARGRDDKIERMSADASDSAPPAQSRNPLHGLTLEHIVTALVAHYGWAELGERIALRCFTSDPSIASSLKFLRKTPWAREKVESLYLYMLRDAKRAGLPIG
jgi:hypothetical protein